MREKTHPSRGFRRSDGILLLLLLVLSLLVLSVAFFLTSDGAFVVVEREGEEIGRYPLAKDQEVRLLGGEEHAFENILRIEDGKARVSYANCPDGICAAHYAISKEGESIVCLPHRLVISVVGGDAS